MRDPGAIFDGTRGALSTLGGHAMTAITKDASEIQSNVHAVMVRLRPIEGMEGRTELTRVGPAWRRAMGEADTEENDRGETEEADASRALEEFRSQHQRRRLGIVTFVLGCSIGILAAVAPHSRFFRAHVLHESAVSAPPITSPIAAVAPAPVTAPAAQSGLAMAPLDIDSLMPKSDVVVAPPTSIVTSKHPHAAVSSSHVAAPTPAPAPVAKASSPHARSHTAAAAPTEDEDAVKNARAADDLAAAQLSDSL